MNDGLTVTEEDVQAPEVETWPPTEDKWPDTPPLHERVMQRPDFWSSLKALRK